MDLFSLLEQQLEKQHVGTLTLGRSKRFREIFFDREAIYTVGNEFAGKIEFDGLLNTKSLWNRIDLPSLEAIILSTDLKHNLLPQVLFDQGLIDEQELEPLAAAQLKEEIIDLLSKNTGSFHYQEGRVPEYLLQYEVVHTRVPVELTAVVEEMQNRRESKAENRELVPSSEEIFVLTERGMAQKQSSSDDFVSQRMLSMVDGFRDLETILNDSYFFEFAILGLLAQALKKGYIKKTIHPELKGISTRGLSPEEARVLLPHFKNAVKYGVDEVAARERLAVLYEKVGMTDDAVIQYNFIGDTLFQMRKAAKAVKAYQRALAVKPGEMLLTDKITKIYLTTAETELAAGNVGMVIQLLEGVVALRPDDAATATKLVDLLISEGKLKKLIELSESLLLAARKSRSPEVAICVLQGCLNLQQNNTTFRRRLINLYLDFELAEEAAQEMELLAYEYLECDLPHKAEDIYEKIRLLPDLKYDTRALGREIKQHLPRDASKSNKRVLLRSVILGVAVLMSVYQTWAFIAWSSIQRGYNLAHAFSSEPLDEEKLISSLDSDERESLVVLSGSKEARFRSLVSRYDKYRYQFPASLFTSAVDSFRDWAQKSVDALMNLRNQKKMELIERAREVLKTEGDASKVRELLEPLYRMESGDLYLELARKLESKAKGQQETRSSARELYKRGSEFEAKNDYRQASRQYRMLLAYYPQSAWANKVKIPFLIDSFPRGAGVFEGEPMLGTTPFPIRLKPGEATLLNARLPGYVPAHRRWISADRFVKNDWTTLVFLLEREFSDEDRVFDLTGSKVVSPPALTQDHIFWGDDRGQIRWGTLEDGRQGARAVSERTLTLLGSPTVTPSAVYSRWSDGKVIRRMSLLGSSKDWRLEEFPSNRIIGTDFLAVKDRILFGSGGMLKEARTKGITKAFKPSYDLQATVLAHHSRDGQILVGSRDGFVRCIEVGRSIRTRWGREITKDKITELVASGEVVVAASRTKLFFLNGSDGRPRGKPLLIGRRHCLHASAGRIFRWTLTRGFEAFAIETREKLGLSETLRIIVQQNKILQLNALPGAIALVLDDERTPDTKNDNRVLICDAKTLEPLLVVHSSTPVLYIAGTKDWIAITEAERISVYKR